MKKKSVLLVFVVSIGLLSGCSKEEFITPIDSAPTGEIPQWNELIQELDFESNIILVENGSSIQEAIDAALPGDVIYVEPGIYREALKVTNQSNRIVGINYNESEKVILENPGEDEKGMDYAVSKERIVIQDIGLRAYEKPGVAIFSAEEKCPHKVNCRLSMNREALGNDIAHYEFNLKMGDGAYDRVCIHRVVKEHKPYFPISTESDVFMVHGAIQDFEDIFLVAGAEEINAETSSPFYLASKNIDVWGIDLAWNSVPIETTDFTFMKHWGVEKDIEHTLKAMSIARLIRGLTRQGFHKMNLLGFSYGNSVIYGAAGHETQIDRICRDIKGIIPVDGQLKLSNEDKIAIECVSANEQKAFLNEGVYENPMGVGLIQLASLALQAPNNPSPVPDFEGLTNIQVMNAIASDHTAGWHFLGGSPAALNYSDPMRFVRLGVNLAPYQPRLTFYETSATACPARDVSFDDYIANIKIPILYLSSEGGDNSEDDYTSSITQSTDISRIHVIDPGQATETNFGHADLWLGYDAAELVWEPLRQWLLDH
jgi:hypothetical protein